MIKMIVSDVAGTTVKDDGLVTKAFTLAMQEMGVDPLSEQMAKMVEYVNQTMGERKIDVFTHLCEGDMERANKAHDHFVEHYVNLVKQGEISEFDGVTEAFRTFRARGIAIAITTGFPREILDEIIKALHWENEIDFSVAASEVEHGRPYPDMINRAVEMYSLRENVELTPDEVVAIGDTLSDVGSGTSAHTHAIYGVTSGAHSAEQLANAGATAVLASFTELLQLI